MMDEAEVGFARAVRYEGGIAVASTDSMEGGGVSNEAPAGIVIVGAAVIAGMVTELPLLLEPEPEPELELPVAAGK